MADKGTQEDFLRKIVWEGGVYNALEYGLTTKDYEVSDEVAERWDELRSMFSGMEELAMDFETDYLI